MRVVITGMGIISPVGNDLETYWQSLISGHSGVDFIHGCCLSQLKCQFAGQVRNLNTKAFLNTRELR